MMTFTKAILKWYENNARDLPWRNTRDPYLIWISEIILQQTRIAQGLGYYTRFTGRFPSVSELTKADEQEVLRFWQGLGYYSRARNLHTAAKEIIEQHQGRFPDSYDKLLKLKGIGEYTAAAIASIAYNHPTPVVDGNVLRFFSRYFGIDTPIDTLAGKRKIHGKALLLIDKKQPGIFNQAIMEFGALYCKPLNPDCGQCIFIKNCLAFKNNIVDRLPVKSSLKKQRIRYFYYFLIIRKNPEGEKLIWLRKRTDKDIWQNLYDFPMIETIQEMSDEELFNSSGWLEIKGEGPFRVTFRSDQIKHVLTHQIIFAKFYIIRAMEKKFPGPFYMLVPFVDIKKYPVPRLIEEFLNQKMVSF